MSKKIMVAVGIAGFLASAGMVFAQSATNTTPHLPTILQVNGRGKVLIRGTVESVSNNSLSISSWGGTWTINVGSSTDVVPSGVTLANINQGDFVGVEGSVDSSADLTITATLVRDWTARRVLTQQIRSNIQAVRETMSSVPHVVQGTLSNLDSTGETFTLTNARGTAYNVTLSSGAEILGRNWATIALSQATDGDTVRVFGTVASSTITATVFRDVSVK